MVPSPGFGACRLLRPTWAATWSTWWRPRQDDDHCTHAPGGAVTAAHRLAGQPDPVERPLVKATLKRLARE